MTAPTDRSLGTLRNCGCAECKAELAYRLGHDGDLYRPATEDDYSQRRLNARLAGTSMEATDWVAVWEDHMVRFPHSKATPALLKDGATYDGPRFGTSPPRTPCPVITEALDRSHIYE